jgi:hypothetical protein
MSDSSAPSGIGLKSGQEFSGRLTVIAMLLVGVLSTAAIFIYWDQHTRPFRPLRVAIGRTFERSRPLVEGGRNRGGPPSLRIAMTVLFDPNADDDQAQETLRKVVELARTHVDLDEYEVLELNLLNFVPEQKTRERSMTVELPATLVRSSSDPSTGQ